MKKKSLEDRYWRKDLRGNSGDRIAIPIRFKNFIGAMTAKKSIKKSAARSAFLVLLIQPFAFCIFLFPSLLSWLNGLVNGFTMQIDSWYATVSLKTDDLMEDERRKRRPQIPVERLVLVKRQGELDGVDPITKNWPKFHLPAQKWRLFSGSCRSRFAI